MNEVANIQPQERQLAAPANATPADMVLYVMKNGGSIDQLEKFMNLQRQWEADQARKAYVADMAEFKKNPPQIIKDKQVGYAGKDGQFVGYSHATLGNVTNAIVEGLAQHGFSHRWDVKQEGAVAHVTCTITHRMGHSESVSMQAAKDDSGKKNQIQQVASAITYLQRYTLLAATGLATHDQQDDDGAAGGLDTTLADKWLAKVRAAKDGAALQSAWQSALAEIRAAKDQHAYDEVKQAVVERRAELSKGATK
jgi:hypothetical protein